jgi:hypothetical protein
MNSEIVAAFMYVEELKRKYSGFEFPAYKLRQWFSKTRRIFFDCDKPDAETCLRTLLQKTNLDSFTIFIVVKEPSNVYRFMDASFKNIGSETLEHFIVRFQQQLESMTKLSVKTAGSEYIECVGYAG